MDAQAPNTSFPKQERLCGKTAISKLLAKGRHGSTENMRFLYLLDTGAEKARLMISVPKKLFKRAVKRNLLKRRIRESWRKQKHLINTDCGLDILIMYATKEVLTYEEIYALVGQVIEKVNKGIDSHKKKSSDAE